MVQRPRMVINVYQYVIQRLRKECTHRDTSQCLSGPAAASYIICFTLREEHEVHSHPLPQHSRSMESLFYVIGVLLSGAFLLHFSSQFSYTIWLIYFIVGKMSPFLNQNDPWDPDKDKRGFILYGDPNDGEPIIDARKSTGKPGPITWGLLYSSAWKANPKAMVIVASLYLVICLILIFWCAYIFALVVRLGEGRQGRAIRTILHLTANRLATPAFCSAIMLAGYLCWGSWVWFSLCEPNTSMRNLNLANALMLTVPNALFTVLWVVGGLCEITHFVRNNRQDDIPLHNLPGGGIPGLGPAPAVAGGLNGAGQRGAREALRREMQVILAQLARIMAILLAFRR